MELLTRLVEASDLYIGGHSGVGLRPLRVECKGYDELGELILTSGNAETFIVPISQLLDYQRVSVR